MNKIIPAILTDSLEEFKEQIKIVKEFAEYAQVDIMDGKFVNNISFDKNNSSMGLIIGKTIGIDLEIHLMVENPLEYIEKMKNFRDIFRVIFHIESLDNPDEVIKKAKSLGLEIGIAINPETSTEKLEPYTDKINQVLFLTVNPGKQGARFLPEMETKVKEFKKLHPEMTVAVDGGISKDTIDQVKSWGVDIFNVGSAIMKTENPKDSYKKLQELI